MGYRGGRKGRRPASRRRWDILLARRRKAGSSGARRPAPPRLAEQTIVDRNGKFMSSKGAGAGESLLLLASHPGGTEHLSRLVYVPLNVAVYYRPQQNVTLVSQSAAMLKFTLSVLHESLSGNQYSPA